MDGLTKRSSDEELHAARIRVKRVRYAAELASHELGKDGKRVVEAARDLQDVLGEHQDGTVAEERIRAWASTRPRWCRGGPSGRAGAQAQGGPPRRLARRLEGTAQGSEAARVSVVRAAGGVPVRAGGGGLEVLIVHRPQYGDWTFPKGKCEPDESDEACALREVEEETGLRCALEDGAAVDVVRRSRGRPKVVRYWRLRVVGGEPTFDHEVDEARWLSLEEAAALLTYPRDLAVLEALQGEEQVSD